MSMSMSMGLHQSQNLVLSQQQSQELKLDLRLLLKQRVKDPGCPNAVTGLEGLRVANTMLEEQGAVGFLVGGVSEVVWSRNRTPGDLALRKDVDVLVLSSHFKLFSPFQGGIDWWLPQLRNVSVETEAYGYDRQVLWWENGNGCTLRFGIKIEENPNTASPGNLYAISPGLHFLSREQIVDMRWIEATFNLQDGRIQIEGDINQVHALFKKRYDGIVRQAMPKFLLNEFSGRVHDPRYIYTTPRTTFEVYPITHSEYLAVNRYQESRPAHSDSFNYDSSLQESLTTLNTLKSEYKQYEDTRSNLGVHEAFDFTIENPMSYEDALRDFIGSADATKILGVLDDSPKVERWEEEISATLFLDSNNKPGLKRYSRDEGISSQEEDLDAAGFQFADDLHATLICAAVIRKAIDSGLDPLESEPRDWSESQPAAMAKLTKADFALLARLWHGWVRIQSGWLGLRFYDGDYRLEASTFFPGDRGNETVWALGTRKTPD